jgi:hypothetical protein
MPPVEFEGGLRTVLFFEHPIRRRIKDRKKTIKVFFIVMPRIFSNELIFT